MQDIFVSCSFLQHLQKYDAKTPHHTILASIPTINNHNTSSSFYSIQSANVFKCMHCQDIHYVGCIVSLIIHESTDRGGDKQLSRGNSFSITTALQLMGTFTFQTQQDKQQHSSISNLSLLLWVSYNTVTIRQESQNNTNSCFQHLTAGEGNPTGKDEGRTRLSLTTVTFLKHNHHTSH